jgi:KaiC/GvpD/RAD55 family RecA-like ATPase
MSKRIIVKKINWRSTKNRRVENVELEIGVEVGFFNCRTANECLCSAKSQAAPKRLFDSLVFENELTILVADTGVGKSIFGVQIANHISATDKVLYFDLELTDKQFQGRYSVNYENEFEFNDNFYRAVFKRKFEMPNNISYEEYFIKCLKNLIIQTGAKVVIIDNMTRLISGDTDQAKNAKPLMDSLNNLKFDFNLTMLLLEHTKKVDSYRPIQLNDLQGSKMKANFADSVFTIGRSSKGRNIRYVKQLKVRSCENEYDGDNVIEYEVAKENSFLHFRHVGYSPESDHLLQADEVDRSNLAYQAKTLNRQGISIRKVALELGISKSSADRLIKSEVNTPAVPVLLPGQMGQISTIQIA